jgi:hypothetical protein
MAAGMKVSMSYRQLWGSLDTVLIDIAVLVIGWPARRLPGHAAAARGGWCAQAAT